MKCMLTEVKVGGLYAEALWKPLCIAEYSGKKNDME